MKIQHTVLLTNPTQKKKIEKLFIFLSTLPFSLHQQLLQRNAYHLQQRRPEQAGFTLVELLVVFVVLGILSSLTMAGFVTYDRVQKINVASYDVAQLLQVAKSRAVSQVKPTTATTCTDLQPLNGYRVRISRNGNDTDELYELLPECGGVIYPAVISKRLPQEFHFEGSGSPGNSTFEFFFDAQTGQVTFKDGGIGEFHVEYDGAVLSPHRSIWVDRFGNVEVTDP